MYREEGPELATAWFVGWTLSDVRRQEDLDRAGGLVLAKIKNKTLMEVYKYFSIFLYE